MPRFIHKVTVWDVDGLDVYSKPTWSAPTVLDARWEDVSEIITTPAGDQITSSARVYVSAPVAVGAYIHLGSSSAASPPSDSYEVKNFQKVENVAGTKVEYKVQV